MSILINAPTIIKALNIAHIVSSFVLIFINYPLRPCHINAMIHYAITKEFLPHKATGTRKLKIVFFVKDPQVLLLISPVLDMKRIDNASPLKNN